MRPLALIILVLLFNSCTETTKKKEQRPPNIILIMADDLGYGELGAYGQTKIETPHLDKLSEQGIRFTQFYSGAPVCAPARCILLTGQHSGHASIRGNHEWGERGEVWNYEKAVKDPNLEGQYPMPDGTYTIASELKKRGYTTGMVGKWGLGAPLSNSIPNTMGFDYFMGYNCQRQAHTYYPAHLWENNVKYPLNNPILAPNTRLPEDLDPSDRDSYDFISGTELATDKMHEKALQFIDKNKENAFFLYYASPIPHAPLQASRRWVDYYVEKFGDEKPYIGDKGYFPARYPHATYAAMISTLDEQVGEIWSKVRDLGLEENTIILFTSDNGPTYNGGTDSPWFDSARPFNSEYSWGKGFVKEGGIRVPMIAYWPEKFKAARIIDHPSSFQDIFATLRNMASADAPLNYLDGISFLPALMDQEQPKHEYLYWEFPEYGGQQAVRLDEWKGIRSNIKKPDAEMQFELFNLKTDIKEENDVSELYPEIVQEIIRIMEKEHTPSEITRFHLPKIGDGKSE